MNDWQSTPNYWEERYAQERTGWERGGPHPALTHWMGEGALKPCSIALPGCGRGHETIALVEAGFRVTAIDFAESAIEETRQRLQQIKGSATLIQSDVLDYRPQRPYDAVYEQTCLCAIDPKTRTRYQMSIFEWLRPGGKLFALFMHTKNDSGEPPFDCELEQMRALFCDERWDWPTEPPQQFAHPSGVGFELAVILQRKAQANVN